MFQYVVVANNTDQYHCQYINPKRGRCRNRAQYELYEMKGPSTPNPIQGLRLCTFHMGHMNKEGPWFPLHSTLRVWRRKN